MSRDIFSVYLRHGILILHNMYPYAPQVLLCDVELFFLSSARGGINTELGQIIAACS